jgi:hypothetical protein
MAQKIYIVESSSGNYEDYVCYNEKAFINRSDAELYAKQLDEEHFSKPSFITDEFVDAYVECYDEAPDWGDGPSDKEAYFAWQDECIKKEREFIISEMHKKGFDINESMIHEYEKYESDSYRDWHKCTIEELELL